jgi:anti-sigma B factor antagonist
LLPDSEGGAMFSVAVSTLQGPGHVTVALRGELDLIDATDVAVALAAAAHRAPLVIVDLAELNFIDVSGVAALARGWHHVRNAGGDLRLAAPQEQVRKMIDIIYPGGDFSVGASAAQALTPQDVHGAALETRSRGHRLCLESPSHHRCDCL